MRCTGSSAGEQPTNGRWSAHEHTMFLEALNLHGREWKKVADYIQTRSSAQIRSHAQKYFAKLEKESEKGIHGGAIAIHGEHVVLVESLSGKKKRKRKRRQLPEGSSSLTNKAALKKLQKFQKSQQKKQRVTGGSSSSSSSTSGGAFRSLTGREVDSGSHAGSQALLRLCAASSLNKEDNETYHTLTLHQDMQQHQENRERSVSPMPLNLHDHTSSPKTARVHAQGLSATVVEPPRLSLDADMSNMSTLLRRREFLVQQNNISKDQDAALYMMKKKKTFILSIDHDIERLYNSVKSGTCMCRRLCHVAHCRSADPSLACITTRRNLLFLIQSSIKASSFYDSIKFEKKMLQEYELVRLEVNGIETSKVSISMYETAQIFAGMSQEAQVRLQDLNETELTAVQVLVGTRMGLKPTKSPLRDQTRGPSPTPQTINKHISRPSSPSSDVSP